MGSAIYGGYKRYTTGQSATLSVRVDQDMTLLEIHFSVEGRVKLTDVDVLGQDDIIKASSSYPLCIQATAQGVYKIVLPDPVHLKRGTEAVFDFTDLSAANNDVGVIFVGRT